MADALTINADEVRTVADALGNLNTQMRNAIEQLSWQLVLLEAALHYADESAAPQLRQALSDLEQVTQLLETAQKRLLVVAYDTFALEADIEQGPPANNPWQIGEDYQNSLAQHGFLSYGSLYSIINGNPSRGDPFQGQPDRIGITQGVGPDGQPVVLVTLRGLDLTAWGKAYNLPNAVLGGLDENNAFKLAVEADLQQYLAAHGLPPDTQIIVAGHSFGGIVAQQLVQDSGQTHFNIEEVITYGSPNLGVNWGDTTHHMFADRYDGVPLLSLHENAPLLSLFGNPIDPINIGGGITGAGLGFFHGLEHGGIGEAFKEAEDWGFIGDHLTGLPGTVATDALLNGHPFLKSPFTGGETIVAGQGDSGNPLKWFGQDHGSYSAGQIYGGGTLQGTPVDFQIYDLGQTQYFDPPATPPAH